MCKAVWSDDRVRYFTERAELYADRGQFSKVSACLESALSIGTDLPEGEQAKLHVRLAEAFRNLQQNSAAIGHYERALKWSGLDCPGDIMLAIGALYHREHEHEVAMKYYRDALLQNPSLPGDVYYHMASTYRRMGEYARALECYDLSLGYVSGKERSVMDWEIERSRGVVHWHNGDLGIAETCFRSVLNSGLCDILGNIYNDLGVIHHAHGRLKEAEDCLNKAAADTLPDTSASGFFHLGELYEAQHRYGEAAVSYRQAEKNYLLANTLGIISPKSTESNLSKARKRIAVLQHRQILDCYKVGMECPHNVADVQMNIVFVAMPFGQDRERDGWDHIYQAGIKPAIEEVARLICTRADEIHYPSDDMCKVCLGIQKAGMVVADLTDGNPNVFYEVGLAHALQKTVVLVARSGQKQPFDLKSMDCIHYGKPEELRQVLGERLKGILEAKHSQSPQE